MATDTGKAPVKISKYLLEMKFMKRTKEREELKAEQEADNIAFKNKEIETLTKEGKRIIIEPSITSCERLRPGRISYKGMNPDIEKLMKEEQETKPAEEDPSEGITSKEMAQRYSSLVDTMAKKFGGKKRTHSDSEKDNAGTQRKNKFRKPKD